MREFGLGFRPVALLAIGALVALGGLNVLFQVWRIAAAPAVVPSFRPKLDRKAVWTAPAGRRLARSISGLDRAAAARGLRPLSTFGLDQGGFGPSRTFYPAEEGLRTVRALLEEMATRRLTVDGGRKVVEALEFLEEGLARVAGEKGVFRLNYR
jgi:hypothetical protein